MSRVRAPRAHLVCVGSELLAGQVNTHQAWLSLRLRRAGFEVAGESSVPDDVRSIASALRWALSKADAVIVCGGLGPTFDDLTREAACAALGLKLTFDPRLWSRIAKRFSRFVGPIPEENKRQAWVISGAKILDNLVGSAPGQSLELHGRAGNAQSLVLLPGPYSEMAPMFERVLPRLRARHARRQGTASLTLRLAEVPESTADERLAIVRSRYPDAEFTILASGGEVSFHATVKASTAPAARRMISRLRHDALNAVGRWTYGSGDDTLESVVGERLTRNRMTLAVAESCTGGLLGARLSSTPGASSYFMGGVIAYSDCVKTRRLGVAPGLIRRYGAVSSECAAAMAAGARAAAGAAIGLSVTGIAGPRGGSKKKPVGLVFLSVSGPGTLTLTRRREFLGPREHVRQRATTSALALLMEALGPLRSSAA